MHEEAPDTELVPALQGEQAAAAAAEYESAPHVKQALMLVWFTRALKVPAGQAVRLAAVLPVGHVYPAGQLVRLEAVLPTPQSDPAGHTVQVATAAAEYVPAGHTRHAVELDCDINMLYVPGLHPVQYADPLAEEYVPAGHAMHEVAELCLVRLL